MASRYTHASDCVILAGHGEDMKLLVIKRKNPPYQGEWALPGGFIDEGESPEDAFLRELEEETSLKLTSAKIIPLTVRKKEGRDPRGPVTSYPFLVWIENVEKVEGGDDAAQAEWVNILELTDLAFDHGAILCEALGKFWEFMPSCDHRVANVPLAKLLKKHYGKNSAYFGGSFNPWHSGHMECLEQCFANQKDMGIVVVPDFNPWKVEQNSEIQRCFYQSYLDICKNLGSTPFSVYPGFWGSEEPNPTVGWLPRTKDDTRALLIGDDSFANITKWKNYSELLNSIDKLFVVPRDHQLHEVEKMKGDIAPDFPDLEIVILQEHPHQHVSSTAIREKS